MFVGFQPAVSPEALKKMSQQVRQWRIHTRTRHDLDELAALINPVVAGLDELLRPVLPVAAVSPPASQQHLPDALGRQEVQAARAYKRFKRWWSGVIDPEPGCLPTGPGRAR